MAGALKHRFQSGKPDGTDATLLQPSHQNDSLVMSGGNDAELPIRDAASADGWKLTAALANLASVTLQAAGALLWVGRSQIQSTADGLLTLLNAAGTGFTRVCWGGVTNAFPALARNGADLHVRLADDSAYAILRASALVAVNVGLYGGPSPAATGHVNVPNAGLIASRNAGNSADSGKLFMSDTGSVSNNTAVTSRRCCSRPCPPWG